MKIYLYCLFFLFSISLKAQRFNNLSNDVFTSQPYSIVPYSKDTLSLLITESQTQSTPSLYSTKVNRIVLLDNNAKVLYEKTLLLNNKYIRVKSIYRTKIGFRLSGYCVLSEEGAYYFHGNYHWEKDSFAIVYKYPIVDINNFADFSFTAQRKNGDLLTTTAIDIVGGGYGIVMFATNADSLTAFNLVMQDAKIEARDLEKFVENDDALHYFDLNAYHWIFNKDLSLRTYNAYRDIRHRPSTQPLKNPFVKTSNTYYSVGCWLGTDSTGILDKGWHGDRPTDLYLYTYDSSFTLQTKKNFEDQIVQQESKMTVSDLHQLVFVDTNSLFLAAAGYEFRFRNESPYTWNRFDPSRVTIYKTDTLGNVLCKREYFTEQKEYNYFPYHLAPLSDGGVLVVMSVLDVNNREKGQTTSVMKIDNACALVGLKEIRLAKPLAVYPNPVKSSLSIPQTPENLLGSNYRIVSSTGALVQEGTLSSLSLELGHLAAGSYVFYLSSPNGTNYQASMVKE